MEHSQPVHFNALINIIIFLLSFLGIHLLSTWKKLKAWRLRCGFVKEKMYEEKEKYESCICETSS